MAWDKKIQLISDTAAVNCLQFTDDGNGGLCLNGQKIAGATVDYTTGMFFIPKAALVESCTIPNYTEHLINSGADAINITDTLQVIQTKIKSGGKAYCKTLANTRTETVNETVTTGIYDFELLQDVPRPKMLIVNSWRFKINGKDTIERNGDLIQNFDPTTNSGDFVGELDPINCTVRIFDTSMNLSEIQVLSGLYSQGAYDIQQYYGRTAACPIKPLSFTVRAEGANGTLVGQADDAGDFSGSLSGHIDYETGFYRVEVDSDNRFSPNSLKYNAVSTQQVPLDADVLGIDTVRLPPNGKVPIFRRGDMVVISNRQKQGLGSAITAGQTIQLDRTDLDRVCIVDFNGVNTNAELYTVDYAQGKITFADPLDLSAYTLPLTAHHAWEEENRVVGVDVVSGTLKLGFEIKRDYTVGDTFISSALVGGDLQVRASRAFSQQSWNKVWADTRQTDPILAQLNDTDYPIELTDDGAINQRWLLRFTSSNAYEVYGETLGLLCVGDTVSDLAPPNPATGKPYFKIKAAAFGGGWAAGNCIRFNTQGTMLPVWVIRAVTPSAEKQTEKDGFTICLRGNTVEDS
ncbi:MAG: hypothetical protein IKZ88_05000 [Neisseriaceae bacterium]|nr:hypothetical protein [Neisseriaceae bacterium]